MGTLIQVVLTVLAVVVGVVGFGNLTEATLGVGIIGLACLLGILARLVQASEQQANLQKDWRSLEEQLARQHEARMSQRQED